jgi:prepilin-type N-terminal cleavage/methylation domain-containing protein
MTSTRGFTLVELLVASVISLFITGTALMIAGAARTALTVEPAALDTVRRLREAVDVVAAAIGSAGGERGIGADSGTIASAFPAVRLASTAAGSFGELAVIRAVDGGRGRLSVDQPGPGGSLTLEPTAGLCPRTRAVCGFDVGDPVAVADGRGHFDVFIVGAVSEPLGRITPRAPLAHAYRAGAWVAAVRSERFELQRQIGGGQTLIRVTAAGAREPLVDAVTRLEFDAWGEAAPPQVLDGGSSIGFARYGLAPVPADEVDAEGIFADGSHCMAARADGLLASTMAPLPADPDGLARLSPADLDDGPWCPHEDDVNRFDADWFRVRRVDVRVWVEALAAEFRGPAGALFSRGGTGAHDAPRWIRDRGLSVSVAVRP